MSNQAKASRKRAAKRRMVRQRTVDQANALHALDRLRDKRRDLAAERRMIVEQVERLEAQNAQWTATITAMRACVDRLDTELLVLDTTIGEAQEVIPLVTVILKLWNPMELEPLVQTLVMPHMPRVGEMFTFQKLPAPYKGDGSYHFRVRDVEYLMGDDGGYQVMANCWAVS